MSKADELELRRFLEGMEDHGEGRVYRDLSAPAVYRLEPTWLTAVLCASCRYIGLVLSIPRRPTTWRCPRCSRRVRLDPPLNVLGAPDPVGQNPRLNRAARRAAGRLVS